MTARVGFDGRRPELPGMCRLWQDDSSIAAMALDSRVTRRNSQPFSCCCFAFLAFFSARRFFTASARVDFSPSP